LLEARDLPTVFMQPTYLLASGAGGAHPLSSSGPSGLSPGQIRHAYGFDTITFAGGSVAGDGSGQTIAIIDAFDDPALVSSTDPNFANSDLHKFDATFGLPDPVFTKVNQNGGTSYPTGDTGWALEISLDVEWAHVVAPKANILLVEASNNGSNNLNAGVQWAARQPGVVAVSMSWGGGEFSGESGTDGVYTKPNGHAGVAFLASSGDSGAPPIYPSISPNVISVGGTTLSVDSSGNWLSESGWSGSGGGISSFEAQPSYQHSVVTQSSTMRTSPDVAYDSNPATGVPVYDSYTNGTSAPWSQVGGTSAAAPQWAGLIAIVDQGRAVNGASALDGRSQILPALYQIPQTDFHDITTGTSTGNPNYSAGPGYDLVTGRGTPIAPLVVRDLIGTPQIQVSDSALPVANGSSVSMSALLGSTTTQTFTVTNNGGQALTLSDPINLPTGFTLASDFGTTTVAPGASTTFVVQINTGTATTYSGTVSFGSNDPSARTFSFTLTGTVGSAALTDDSYAGFSATSGWLFATGSNYTQYYQSNTHYIQGRSSSSDVATWSFPVTPGTYEVSANWVPFSNRATNASYTIKLGNTTLGTATINQQNGPVGFSYGGLTWQDLGAGTFTVSTAGTLTVQLAGTGNGFLIADPMLVQQKNNAPAPLAQVYDGSTLIADNSGSDNFGSTLVGVPITKTFTVKNAGNATLTLSDPITLPSGFTLVSDFGSTSLAPGATTTFIVQLGAAAAGSYSGTLSFGTNDSNNNPYSFTVSGTVGTTQVVDDDQSGFTATSGWLFAQGSNYTQYYNSDTHYIFGRVGSTDVASWSFNVTPGVYEVSASWVPYSNRATNAQYTILLGNTVLGTATINQQNAPGGYSYNGAQWQDLGAGQFAVNTAGTLTVQLAGTGNGYLIADPMLVKYLHGLSNGPQVQVSAGSNVISGGGSLNLGSFLIGVPVTQVFTVTNTGGQTLTLSDPIRLPTGFTLVSDFGSTSLAPNASTTFVVQMNTTVAASYSGTVSFGTNDPNNNPFSFTLSGTVTSAQLIDDDMPGFTATSGWLFAQGSNYTQYYNSDTHYIFGRAGSTDVASWSFAVGPGTYEVSASWVPYSNRATNAQYTILLGNTVLGTATINQQNAPNGFSYNGALFQDLGVGIFTIPAAGTLTVQLAGTGNGYLIADPVLVQWVSNASIVPASAGSADAGLAIILAGDQANSKHHV
jgi:hypothetical protein